MTVLLRHSNTPNDHSPGPELKPAGFAFSGKHLIKRGYQHA